MTAHPTLFADEELVLKGKYKMATVWYYAPNS